METVENNGEQFIQLGNQLVKLGNQLQTERHAKALKEFEESFILPESEDFLTEFSWEINLQSQKWWEVHGTPVSTRAKSIMGMTSKLNKLFPNHPKIQEFWKRLQSWTPSDEQAVCWPHENLRWHFLDPTRATEKLAAWLHTFSHLHFTNLSEAADKIREIIEKEKAELRSAFEKRDGELEEALKNLLHCFPRNDLENMKLLPVAADAIDWNDVAAGKQQAPKLINILDDRINNRREGDWIYVGPPKDTYGDLDYPYWGWDPADSDGLSKERAIASMNHCSPPLYYRFSALYRYKGNGIAELVASKHKGTRND